MILTSPVHPLIGIDPEIRFGRPCIAGNRISVRDVLGWLGNGMSVAEIIEDFSELTPEFIQACQSYAADCIEPYTKVFERAEFSRYLPLVYSRGRGHKIPEIQHIRWDFRYEDRAILTVHFMI